MKYIAIIGRTPSLSIAELEAIFGAPNILPIAGNAVLISSDKILDKAKDLGGTIKIAKILTELPNDNWNYIVDYLTKNVPIYLDFVPHGKLTIGISTYGISVSPGKINACALSLKKLAKNYGRSVRIIPNKTNALNSAQVLHNKLTGEKGWELVCVATESSKTILAQTVYEQDIEDYASRDQRRPFRDPRVGMLPPKLAQTIINLGAGHQNPPGEFGGNIILDPFCGTGVILQEATLMGYCTYGTDIDPKMIEYTDGNMLWLQKQYPHLNIYKEDLGRIGYKLEVADATTHHWNKKTVVACETYLGRALTKLPDDQTLNKIVQDCDTIHKKFLKNLANELSPGLRACIAVPAWKTKYGFRHLPALDRLEELGYNRISFVHVNTKDLIYHRNDQTVARELVVIVKK